jgi:hypothetical protein
VSYYDDYDIDSEALAETRMERERQRKRNQYTFGGPEYWEDWMADEDAEEEPCCPECGSEDIEHNIVFFDREWTKPVPKDEYWDSCDQCDHMWRTV